MRRSVPEAAARLVAAAGREMCVQGMVPDMTVV